MSQPLDPSANIFRVGDGTVGRQTYALVGIIGFAIKNNLDRYVARYFFLNLHSFFDYWAPSGKAARLNHLSKSEVDFLFAPDGAVHSVPVGRIGHDHSPLARCRATAVAGFLIFRTFREPDFFHSAAAFPPSKSGSAISPPPFPHVRPLDDVIPRGKLGAAVLATTVTTVLGLLSLLLTPR